MKYSRDILLGTVIFLFIIAFTNLTYADQKDFWVDIPSYLDKIRSQFEVAVKKHQKDKSMPLYIEKVHVEMTDDQSADYSWRGYHYWARRMGFGL